MGHELLTESLRQAFEGSRVKILPFECDRWRIRADPSNYDVIQITAFGASSYWLKRALIIRAAGKPLVRYWVGSDVLRVLQSDRERALARLAGWLTSANVAQWHNLKEELRSVGLRSQVLPAPNRLPRGAATRPPSVFTVLTYLPKVHWSLYNGDMMLRLAAEHPEWSLLVVGRSGKGMRHTDNVRFLGFVTDMDSVYEQASVLVRMTQHDGLPRMILEALAKGLHVVWSQPLKGCAQASGYEELVAILAHMAKKRDVNETGHALVFSEFNPDRLRQEWYLFYRSLLE